MDCNIVTKINAFFIGTMLRAVYAARFISMTTAYLAIIQLYEDKGVLRVHVTQRMGDVFSTIIHLLLLHRDTLLTDLCKLAAPPEPLYPELRVKHRARKPRLRILGPQA